MRELPPGDRNALDTPGYRLLGGISAPADLRTLERDALPALAVEIRRYLIETLGRVGGHFAASLGTVELTLALHCVLDTPRDALIWDVGHQAYGHKIVTGRRAQLASIRQRGGLAPFPERDESEYDVFGTGHSSTALSAAAGIAAARRLRGDASRVAAVIGDGGLTAGMAFEALNHIGGQQLPVLMVLNDNDMSISENVGGLREQITQQLHRLGVEAPHHLRPSDRDRGTHHLGDWLGAMGIDYAGPVDGHDLPALLQHLDALRDHPRPVLLHAITVKGKGYPAAEAAPIRWHSVGGFDPVTATLQPAPPVGNPTFTEVFGQWICDTAAAEPALVAITPAMREGSGLTAFAENYRERCFDVGIAEQHAVTFAGGLATQGMQPVVAIYSTFLQRAYDQLIHDVAAQRLPVLFAIDRAGLVGGDGATHQGAFDHAYLRAVPNLVVMAPSDENECRSMLATGLALQQPAAVRYPKGCGRPVAQRADASILPVGRARRLREVRRRREARVALLAFGAMVGPAMEAAELLDASVYDMRFVKPLDADSVLEAAAAHDLLVSIEEAAIEGGAGDGIAGILAGAGAAAKKPLLRLGLPDCFIAHGTRDEQLQQCGLDCAGIQRAVYAQLRGAGKAAGNDSIPARESSSDG